MKNLQKIEEALYNAQQKIHSYKTSVSLYSGLDLAKEMLEKDREELANSLTVLCKTISSMALSEACHA